MVDYIIPGPDDRNVIGSRAKRLRDLLGMTVVKLAAAAGVHERDVMALEEGDTVSLAAALAIHGVLSGDGAGDALFTRPRLQSIDEVEEFERRRLTGR